MSSEAEPVVAVEEAEPSATFAAVHQLDVAVETKTHEEDESVYFKT